MPGYNRRVDVLRGSPTRRIDEVRERLAREGRDVILLSTGQPGVPPPRWLRELVAGRLLGEGMGVFSYTPSSGRLSLREAIAGDLRRLGGVEIEPGQVVATAGGQEAMYAALSVLLEPGDRVVVLDPMYFGYWPLLDYLGVEPVAVGLDASAGFEVDVDAVAGALESSGAKALIIVDPDNPTGRVLGEEEVRGLAEAAVDAGAWLIVDEAYRTLVYEGSYTHAYPYAPENTVAVGTFSKDPGIPGWRLGYVYGPRWVAEKVKLVSEEIVYCPPSIAQVLVEEYLSRPEERRAWAERLRGIYRERRDALLDSVRGLLPEARTSRPRGGMFALVDLEPYLERAGIGAEELAEKLLLEEAVAVVPGPYFGRRARSSIRVSFAAEPPERIREGIERLAGLLERLGAL